MVSRKIVSSGSNSIAAIIPLDYARHLNLNVGDRVEWELEGKTLRLTKRGK